MRHKSKVPLVNFLPQNRLPTELQVLGNYLWQKKQCTDQKNPRKYALNTALSVKETWLRAHIGTKSTGDIMRQLISSKNSVVKR